MRFIHALSGLMLLASASAASATITDPVGDFISTYTGPLNGDLDVLGAGVTFDGSAYTLTSTQNGAIGTTVGSIFVWGINRGAGAPRLTFGSPSVGAGVLFDAVVVMFPDGTLRVVTIPSGGPPTINVIAGGTSIAGDSLSAVVPLSLLGSTGLLPADYTFSLWSRTRVNPTSDGTNAEIADFAPDLGMIRSTMVPEPSTWLTMILGFGLAGGAMRFARRRRASPTLVGVSRTPKEKTKMRHSSKLRAAIMAIAAGTLIASQTPALAGEISGNGKPIDVNARSECAYSGLNDNTPDPRDPGGKTQSYGTLVGQFDWIDPQNLDPNAPYFQPIPGYACNPNRARDLHSGG